MEDDNDAIVNDVNDDNNDDDHGENKLHNNQLQKTTTITKTNTMSLLTIMLPNISGPGAKGAFA